MNILPFAMAIKHRKILNILDRHSSRTCWLMMKPMKNDNGERKPLISKTDVLHSTVTLHLDNEKCNMNRRPSSFESARSSWTRWLHVLFWWWLNPLLMLGYKQILTDADLDDLPDQERCLPSFQKLLLHDFSTSATWHIIMRAFRKEQFFTGLLLIPYLLVRLAQPLILRAFLQQLLVLQSNSLDVKTIAIMLAGIILSSFVRSLVLQQFSFRTALVGCRIRHGLSAIIYQHLLSISTSSVGEIAFSQIINLLTHDISKFEDFCTDGHYLWVGLLETLCTFGILWWILGLVSTVLTLALILSLILMHLVVGKLSGRYYSMTMVHTDKRLKAFNEILYGCQLIKIYNWEEHMKKRVIDLRQDELNGIKRNNHLRAYSMSLFFFAPCLLGCVAFSQLLVAWTPAESRRCVRYSKLFYTVKIFSIPISSADNPGV